jgi:peptidylprolyl isomerase
MATVKEKDTVRIHYTGKLEDGSVFDSSEGEASLELKLGQGEFLPGIENGLIGMNTGESKTIVVPAEQGYGPHYAERVFNYESSKLPSDFVPEVGKKMNMYRADGKPIMVIVTGMSGTSVTLDCNHPLAGKTLIFDVTLEEIL